MTLLAPASEDEAHVAERLRTEPVAWLGTGRPDGRPHGVPVWFGWDDRSIVVFSPPTARKVANLRANPACTLGVESADGGNDVVIVSGRAELAAPGDADRLAEQHGFVAKYESSMSEGFPAWVQGFAQPIVVTVERLVAWSKPAGQPRYVVRP